MIFAFRRAEAIGKYYSSIKDNLDEFFKLAKALNDKDCVHYLSAQIDSLINQFNKAYFDDDKVTNGMLELYKTTDYCLSKAKSIYETKCGEPFYETLLDLFVNFIKKDYLRNGRNGVLSVKQVKDFRSTFDKYFEIIERLADKKIEKNKLEEEMKNALLAMKKSSKGFLRRGNEAANEEARTRYNKAAYLFNSCKKSIELDLAELGTLQSKDLQLALHNDKTAASVIENAEQAKFYGDQLDKDNELAKDAETRLYGNSLAADYTEEELADDEFVGDLPQLSQEESNNSNKLDEILNAINLARQEAKEHHEQTNKEIRISRSAEQSHFDKLSTKLRDLQSELKKLTDDEFIQKMASFFEGTAKEEKDSDTVPEVDQSIVFENELNDRNISTKDTIQKLLKLDPPTCYISSYAVLRALIDSWCRYGNGVEMNNSQRIFLLSDDNGNTLTDNLSIFRCVFGERAKAVNKIWIACNSNIHGDVTNPGNADQVRDYAKTLVEDIGVDFSKINYLEGVKRLYKQEIDSINRLVDGEYNSDELSAKGKPAKIYEFAMKRLEKYKNYLADKVDESFFKEAGQPKQLA